MRILYLQYTNPAGYPPLLHSSRILAEAGWEVLFLGTEAVGTACLEFPPHRRIRVRKLRRCASGWNQKVHYAGFGLWAFGYVLRWRPDWIYASDPLSCPVALLLNRIPGVRVVYHEHDGPLDESGTRCGKTVLVRRGELARRAAFCLLPNERRVRRFAESTGTQNPVVCVWNCPSRAEALPDHRQTNDVIVQYHGNIGPDLLPPSVLEGLALVPGIQLRVIGYTTRGQEHYPERLRQEAKRREIGDRVQFVPVMSRAALLEETRKSSLGLSLMPLQSTNPNFQAMTGASNKTFDYLACAVPVLVSDLPDWQATFVKPGYGLACNPAEASSIAGVFRWIVQNQTAARAMGELGRRQILTEWNYEKQFGRVTGVHYLNCHPRLSSPYAV